ncbi:MAG: class I SAM-dependent methyltransferase [Steroidobacteraceae bacterium]
MTLVATDERNAEQAAYWNGANGERWWAQQHDLDILLAPVMDVLLQRAAPAAGEVVLDVGCGCGTTSVELARRIMPRGRVLGVDISAPMLQQAREHAPADLPLDFVLADATAYNFAPGAADLLFSRFGVMFFAEPRKSFTNMRRGLRRGARLVFACWREPKQNPWLMVPFEEVCRHVARPPAPGPEAPGPFAFADERRVHGILDGAGFREVALAAADLSFDIGIGRGLEAAVEISMGLGPASRALDGQPAELRTEAAKSIRAALGQYRSGSAVALPGAIWIVSARNP